MCLQKLVKPDLTIGVDNSSPTKPDVKQAIIAQQKVSKYEMLKQKLGY